MSGGGVMGLPAAGGVLRFLEERKLGFDWGNPGLRIPIVVSAVIDDLSVGDPRIRPDAEAAYQACEARDIVGPVAEGNVGAGTGATIGKMHRGRGYSGMKGGLGTASVKLGDVIDRGARRRQCRRRHAGLADGAIVAGARRPDGSFADSVDVDARNRSRDDPCWCGLDDQALRSTTLAVVATNVELRRPSLTKVAMMANCGAARAIRPYHTTGDGDRSSRCPRRQLRAPRRPAHRIGALAADLVADAIVRGVRAARSIEGGRRREI